MSFRCEADARYRRNPSRRPKRICFCLLRWWTRSQPDHGPSVSGHGRITSWQVPNRERPTAVRNPFLMPSVRATNPAITTVFGEAVATSFHAGDSVSQAKRTETGDGRKGGRPKTRLEPQSARGGRVEGGRQARNDQWRHEDFAGEGDARECETSTSCVPYSGQINGLFRNFPLWVLLVSLPLTRPSRTPISCHRFWFLLP